MTATNAETIERVFNETFIPASENDYVPITSDNTSTENLNFHEGRNRETLFIHRSVAPDPEEVCLAVPYIMYMCKIIYITF